MKGPRRRRRRTARRKRKAAARRAPPKRGRKRRRRGGRILLLLVLLAAGAGYLYATRVVFPIERVANGEFIEVPDLTGARRGGGARGACRRGVAGGARSTLSVTRKHRREGSSASPPSPASSRLPGAALTLTYSLGPERRPVPDVTELGGGAGDCAPRGGRLRGRLRFGSSPGSGRVASRRPFRRAGSCFPSRRASSSR